MIVEVYFYKTFKERLQLMKKIQNTQKSRIEVYENYLYVTTKIELN